ncbi:MAG: acyl carrier protein [Candidatus Aegiribacteria sp.]|nr:acyl carrier protein [Candidatus Aegiribacteria sp.]MBD3294731.1 acyl carrier protein [Candidatus Fermentibacteria bacterium]
MSLESRVTEIIIDKLGVKPEQVTKEAQFDTDLGADSIDQYELIMGFEDAFGLRIDEDEATELTTVGKVIEYLKEKDLDG